MSDPTMTNPNEPKIFDIRTYMRKVRLSQASLPKL